MMEQEPADKEGIPSLRGTIICHPRPKKGKEKKKKQQTQGWQGVDKDIKPPLPKPNQGKYSQKKHLRSQDD